MRYLWPVLLWCLWVTPPGASEYWNFKTGYDAYDSGEFQLAAYIYKRLADKGDARAQNELGFLYSVGQGVKQNFETAATWFHKAAEQAHAPALLHLADLFAAGRGVEKDIIEAHKLYSLASLLDKSPAQRRIASSRRDAVAQQLDATQLTVARERACRWWRTHDMPATGNDESLPECAPQ